MSGQRHHRRLVDDDEVVGEPVLGVVTRAAGDGDAEEAVKGSGLDADERFGHRRFQLWPLTAASWTAVSMRVAALPVGAARATSRRSPLARASVESGDEQTRDGPASCPSPGPPPMTVSRLLRAFRAASCCTGSAPVEAFLEHGFERTEAAEPASPPAAA